MLHRARRRHGRISEVVLDDSVAQYAELATSVLVTFGQQQQVVSGTDVPNRDRRSLGSLGGSFVTPFAARRTRRGAIILSQQEISEFEENTARNMLPWIGQPLLLTEPRGFPSLFHLVNFGVFSAY